MKSSIRKVAVYDLETGGLKLDLHPITEIAIVIVDMEELEIVDEYSSMIKPYDDSLVYSEEALNTTHMSIDELKNEGKESKEVVKEVSEFLKSHAIGNNKPLLAGHNIKAFDNDFLIKLFKDHKKDVTKFVNIEDCEDTLKLAHKRWPELPNYGLGTCANELGLTLKEAHRALPDTIANAKFLIKLYKALRGEGAKEVEYKRRKFKFQI